MRSCLLVSEFGTCHTLYAPGHGQSYVKRVTHWTNIYSRIKRTMICDHVIAVLSQAVDELRKFRGYDSSVSTTSVSIHVFGWFLFSELWRWKHTISVHTLTSFSHLAQSDLLNTAGAMKCNVLELFCGIGGMHWALKGQMHRVINTNFDKRVSPCSQYAVIFRIWSVFWYQACNRYQYGYK